MGSKRTFTGNDEVAPGARRRERSTRQYTRFSDVSSRKNTIALDLRRSWPVVGNNYVAF
jgi:hypothetical protein